MLEMPLMDIKVFLWKDGDWAKISLKSYQL